MCGGTGGTGALSQPLSREIKVKHVGGPVSGGMTVEKTVGTG